MGEHTRPIVLTSVVSMRKTELRNLVTVPLRKAVRKVIPLQADRAFGTDYCLRFLFVILLFLNRTLLGDVESLRSESGI